MPTRTGAAQRVGRSVAVPARHGQADVVSAKPEGVGKRDVHLPLDHAVVPQREGRVGIGPELARRQERVLALLRDLAALPPKDALAQFDLEVDRRGKHSAVNLVPVQD